MTETPQWAEDLAASQNEMQQTLTAILERFDGIADEIGPLIERVQNSPIMKMFGGKPNA